MSELIKNGAIGDDEWILVRYPTIPEDVEKQAGKPVQFKLTGAEAASAERIASVEIPAGPVIVPLAVWLARRAELAPRLAVGKLGVWLASFELVEDLVASLDDINALPVIALDFPKFIDGRGFSSAALLRTRYAYRNELRAIGDVLRDQLYFMQRCGFDAWTLRADRSASDALASFKDFSDPYQGAADDPQPLWRRHARS
ncbi:DUF934 domain-containing protein [Niveibacterium terrae]|uniref:DUF934 domain-containing protein n=1 Tax=Niveibacterium terrae TaxID=3373598 RepID=UPI003A8F704A